MYMRTQILSKLKYFTQKLLTYLLHIVALQFLTIVLSIPICHIFLNILQLLKTLKIKIVSRQVKILMMHFFLLHPLLSYLYFSQPKIFIIKNNFNILR